MDDVTNKVLEYYSKLVDKSDFVPSNINGNVAFLYSDDTGYSKAKFAIFKLNLNPETVLKQVSKNELLEVLEGLGGSMDNLGINELEEGIVEDLDESNILLASYEDAPIIKLVNQLIVNAVKEGASDIHIETSDKVTSIRLRIDGNLQTVKQYPNSIHETLVARIKVISALDVSETRKAQDGRINLKVGNRVIDIRVSCIPAISGEKIVLRILEHSKALLSLEKIGMRERLFKQFAHYIHRPNGIILLTGPTGSGKSTTLYAAIMEMDRVNKNILTIEDPVEYNIDQITQVQVNDAVGLTFAQSIRYFLRQDPDVILVGEIRDSETAEAAVQASLTGHLVLSTLHTNNAIATVGRLVDMKVEPFLLSSSLLLVVAQRLVRKICPHCREKVELPESLIKSLKIEEFGITEQYEGKGCDKCMGKGFRGRSGVFEALEINDDIRRLITQKASDQEIREAAIKAGFIPMLQDGLDLVRSGVTTIQEIMAIADIE